MAPTLRTDPLVITTEEDFPRLLDLIHDEYFDLDAVRFDRAVNLVRIPYRRIFHGDLGCLIRNGLLFKTYEVDVIRSELSVRNVEEYAVRDRSHIGTYSFNTVTFADGVVSIQCNEDLDLRLVVPRLEIQSRDLHVKGKTRITRGFFWSSNTGKVYE